ncbi:MAG: hypothetical protein COA89_17615, partial [Acidithiobacillus sp.]
MLAGNSAITQEQRDEWEMVVCYDLKSGQERWSHRDRVRFDQMPAGVGPRATPTIVEDRVYTLGATGILNCLELETGEGIWSKDIIRDNNAKAAPWWVSGS